MRTRRLATNLALLTLLLGGLLTITPPRARADGGTAGEACFAETGFCVRGRFLEYWQANGGLARNGFPLSNERQEILEDGNTYTVQYFERARLEYHPENAAPYDVLLGQFGRRIARTGDHDFNAPLDTAPAAPLADQVYFAETGHNLGDGFLAYWQANGGLAQFGYPLTEVIEQRLDPSTGPATYRVQYFERARLEYHPENPAPYDILLGQFGRRILAESGALAGVPAFNLLYLTDEHVQAILGFVDIGEGNPLATVAAPGAYQGFEHGAMLYRGDLGGIYVLCGDERAGQAFPGPKFSFYLPDTWREGDDPGGGPGPRPGLYEPVRGFGKLWRNTPAIRDCLGYATAPGETPYTIQVQPFARGQMLSAATPAGQFIYVVHRTAPSGTLYERYPSPTR